MAVFEQAERSSIEMIITKNAIITILFFSLDWLLLNFAFCDGGRDIK